MITQHTAQVASFLHLLVLSPALVMPSPVLWPPGAALQSASVSASVSSLSSPASVPSSPHLQPLHLHSLAHLRPHVNTSLSPHP